MNINDNQQLSHLCSSIKKIDDIINCFYLGNEVVDFQLSQFKRLKSLSEKLWYHLLNSKAVNFCEQRIDELGENLVTPWDVAINYHLECFLKEKPVREYEITRFDPCEYYSIPIILKTGKFLFESTVVKIYEELENLIFIINNNKKFEELNVLVSQMIGHCYGILEKNPIISKAFLIRKIIKSFYENEVEEDPSFQILFEYNLHHIFVRMIEHHWRRDDVFNIYSELMSIGNKESLKKVDILLKIGEQTILDKIKQTIITKTRKAS